MTLDPFGFLTALPLIGCLFPNFNGKQGGLILTHLFDEMMRVHVTGLCDPRHDAEELAKLQARVRRVIAVVARHPEKILYTLVPKPSPSSVSDAPAAGFDARVVGTMSLPAFFLRFCLGPLMIFRYLMADKRYAGRFLPICYDDLLTDPESIWTQTALPFCRLTMKTTSTTTGSKMSSRPLAMTRDSQQNSEVRREALKQHVDVLSSQDLDALDQMMALADVAPSLKEFRRM